MNKKRIFLFEFHQESNTFNPITAKLEGYIWAIIPTTAARLKSGSVNYKRAEIPLLTY